MPLTVYHNRPINRWILPEFCRKLLAFFITHQTHQANVIAATNEDLLFIASARIRRYECPYDHIDRYNLQGFLTDEVTMQGEQRHQLRHDILGCLNSIRLSLEVIGDSHDPQETIAFLGCIANEVTQAERIVGSLFDEAPPTPTMLPAHMYEFVAVHRASSD